MEARYNVYDQNCPARKLIESISDKWTILIMCKLQERTWRFGELRREIGGISQKMLMQTLRNLEKNGFVIRETFPVLPLRVEYSLTWLGKSLSNVLEKVNVWAEEHMDAIMLAQHKFQIEPGHHVIPEENALMQM